MDYKERLQKLKDRYGLASDSELIRFAINKLEEGGVPALLASRIASENSDAD